MGVSIGNSILDFLAFLRQDKHECSENVGTYVGTYKKQPEAIWLLINDIVVNPSDPAGIVLVHYNIHKVNDLMNTIFDLANIWQTFGKHY